MAADLGASRRIEVQKNHNRGERQQAGTAQGSVGITDRRKQGLAVFRLYRQNGCPSYCRARIEQIP